MSVLAHFQAIAPTYDRNNALSSFGLHTLWNRALVATITSGPYLDLCAGTGAIAFRYLKRCKTPHTATLLDFCPEMLAIARQREPSGHCVTYVTADAQDMPLPDNTYGSATIAYGIRNIPCPQACAREVFRVLKPGATWSILELTRPRRWLPRLLHKLYLKTAIPLIGRLCSPSAAAYQHLSDSVQSFISPDELAATCQSVGFEIREIRPLTLGTATLIQCVKPSPPQL